MGSRVRDGPELSPQRPRALEVTVDKLVPGGAGFCQLPDGRNAFVPGALPGERVRLTLIEDKGRYANAVGFELLEPSAERVVPPCEIAAACGGCDWMALARPAQLRYKAALVAEALSRTGGLTLPKPPELLTAGEALGYRLRIRVHIGVTGRVGFHGRGSRDVVEVTSCRIVVPAIDAVIGALAALPADRRRLLARFEAAELTAAPSGEGVELELFPRKGQPAADESAVAELSQLLPPSVRVRSGAPAGAAARFELPGDVFVRVPPGVFTQVNWEVNRLLVGTLVAGARERSLGSFLDLYAGVGNFTLPLSSAGLGGVAVERTPAAARALRSAAREQSLRCEVHTGDVGPVLARLVREAFRPDLVVLDPPRVGAKEAIASLLSLRPRAVAYVACDPVTLARDLRALVDGGYRVESVTCFDMFPHTHHVETLAWLERA